MEHLFMATFETHLDGGTAVHTKITDECKWLQNIEWHYP